MVFLVRYQGENLPRLGSLTNSTRPTSTYLVVCCDMGLVGTYIYISRQQISNYQ